MQNRVNKKFFTHDAYLDYEESSENRNEFYKGEIFAMSGGSANHNTITLSVASELSSSLSEQYRVFMSDMKVRIEKHDLDTYPDIMVVCGDLQFYENRDDIILNPIVIFEVLSKSTEAYDRGNTFAFYRSIPSFKEYIMIDQYQMHVEQFYLQDEKVGFCRMH
ncbi:MAG: Uma2 family endonuclease [bacterium]